MFTQVIIRKRKTDGRTDVRRTDGQTDDQRETIIPRHYCVAGYKKKKKYLSKLFLFLNIIYKKYNRRINVQLYSAEFAMCRVGIGRVGYVPS